LSCPNTTEEMIPPAVVGEPKRVLREPVKRFRRKGFPSKAREYNERMGLEQMPIVRRGFQPSPSRRQFDTPQHASREIKALTISLGADLVGICRLREAWVYADRDIPGPFAITLAMEMSAEEIEKAPGPEALTETLRVYHDLGLIIIKPRRGNRANGIRGGPPAPVLAHAHPPDSRRHGCGAGRSWTERPLDNRAVRPQGQAGCGGNEHRTPARHAAAERHLPLLPYMPRLQECLPRRRDTRRAATGGRRAEIQGRRREVQTLLPPKSGLQHLHQSLPFESPKSRTAGSLWIGFTRSRGI